MAVVFLVDTWQGTIATSTDETTNVRFFAPDEIPENVMDVYRETLTDLQQKVKRLKPHLFGLESLLISQQSCDCP